MSDYLQYQFSVEPEQRDILLAFLSRLPFESFEETDEGLMAYAPVNAVSEETISRDLEALGIAVSFTMSARRIEAHNWNETWEANFQPIRIDDFCSVRAEFHPPAEGVQYEVIIQPRMAFGTGHHETTFMMIGMMSSLNLQGTKVLDYGCGTGILAILAGKMGAIEIDAVDIEEAAVENTITNADNNAVGGIRVIHGTLSAVKGKGYDLILANINRNVILKSLSSLYEKLSPNGVILLSGILITDRAFVIKEAEKEGFSLREQVEKGEWCGLKMHRI